ncbi:MAG: glycosyltransferase family 4 protein [Planctomycetota bacterium]|jgi:glycosyltransferase involved in cell wall biosynthesis
MSKEQNGSAAEAAEKKTVRPVLIASPRTVYEYSMFLKHLLAGLTEESIPSVLVCPPGSDVDPVISPLVEVIRHPAIDLPFLGPHNLKILAERLGRFKPTVLHCLCESLAKLTRQLTRPLDLPYVLMVDSLHRSWGRPSVSPRRCALILVPGKVIAANLARLHPRLADRIKQTGIGTFVSEWSNCFRDPGRLASIVTAYQFGKLEDFEKLLGAVRHLVIDGYEFMMVVISAGWAEKQLRKLITALGLSQTIVIVPKLTAWRSVIAAGDIFIRPQPTACFDPFLLEAMSVGAAVAACKGGVDDLIIDSRTCVVFDPKDELSIYNSLQRLFDRREFARQIAEGARQYLRENHPVSQMVADILQTYRDAEQWYRSPRGEIQLSS